ncbi:2,4-dienoyl-CoA reductase (NADPH2) [Desulfitobacterium sp. LBE]|uniref:oxidoreductase n=1 Tax=Desulfitobacterium sp. LBE TaxID=884086 RepID=UPI00119AB875|nr:FAD-dependent oxidoreductase [Desulfitobacterium sp. LBE]TWH58027.1 2,4-dienoyl-CoA reductase (NADPH2) [Desulfitobacterium sp. LBE]
MSQFPLLSSPVKLGSMLLKNRMITTSMSPGHDYTDEEGQPTLRFYNYLEERAAGGTALICQTVCFYPRLKSQLNHLHPLPLGYGEEHLPHLSKMAEVVHKHGGLIVGQPYAVHDWKPAPEEKEEYWGPSTLSVSKHSPKPMTKEHIRIFKENIVQCCVILQKAGWDGVEVMAGVGGILNRFMSPATNDRTDEYGGSLENRCRLTVEVMAEIKKACGEDYPMIVRWSPVDFIKGSLTMEESLQIVKILEEAGAVLHNLAPGWHETSVPLTIKDVPEGYWSWISEEIKKVAKIPVATAYRNTDPFSMEEILAKDKADVIAGLRYNIADPEFAKKVMEGRPEDINKCICCCRCLDDVISQGKPLNYCGVNPRLGEELETPLAQAKQSKKVMVIGSGPGGLAAAVTAARRGHKVTIYERGPRLGGCLVMSAIFSPIYDRLNTYYKTLLKKHPEVKVHLNTAVTPAQVTREKPDAVIVAIGGHPIDLKVPGAEGGNVVKSHDFLELLNGNPPQKPGIINKVMYNCGSVFLKFFYTPDLARTFMGKFPWPLGKKIAIIGGGLPGCELAKEMMHYGRELVIIEEKKKIGHDVGGSDRFHIVSAFKKSPRVTMETLTKVKAITRAGVKVVHEDGSEAFHQAKTVAVTLGFEKNMELAEALKGRVSEVYAVGDCSNPARMADATKAGYKAACQI